MTLSISLSILAEARLREKAAAVGKDPAAYASELLEEVVTDFSAIAPSQPSDEAGPTVGERLAPLLRQAWSLKSVPDGPPLRGDEAEVQQLVVDKFRKQGLRL
jgi:hypothetical protein